MSKENKLGNNVGEKKRNSKILLSQKIHGGLIRLFCASHLIDKTLLNQEPHELDASGLDDPCYFDDEDLYFGYDNAEKVEKLRDEYNPATLRSHCYGYIADYQVTKNDGNNLLNVSESVTSLMDIEPDPQYWCVIAALQDFRGSHLYPPAPGEWVSVPSFFPIFQKIKDELLESGWLSYWFSIDSIGCNITNDDTIEHYVTLSPPETFEDLIMRIAYRCYGKETVPNTFVDSYVELYNKHLQENPTYNIYTGEVVKKIYTPDTRISYDEIGDLTQWIPPTGLFDEFKKKDEITK